MIPCVFPDSSLDSMRVSGLVLSYIGGDRYKSNSHFSMILAREPD